MGLEQQLNDTLKQAMMQKDQKTADVVRMIKTRIMERRTAKGFSGAVDDALVLDVISAYRKQLLKAVEEFESAWEHGQRPELDDFLPSDGALRQALAVELALADPPEIALLDIGLPGIDGYDVAREIRGADSTDAVYLVALTGYGQPLDRRRALESGFNEHLVKPLNREKLLRLMASLEAPAPRSV